jgi:hypothetical protein
VLIVLNRIFFQCFEEWQRTNSKSESRISKTTSDCFSIWILFGSLSTATLRHQSTDL